MPLDTHMYLVVVHKQFDAEPHQSFGTKRFDFQFYERIIELWRDRVKPEQLIDKLWNIRKAEEEEELNDLNRGTRKGYGCTR